MKINTILYRVLVSIESVTNTLFFKIITVVELCYLGVTGIDIGRRCLFKGWTSFNWFPKSTIRIGSSCHFNSSIRTNPIGINHRCIITTMSPNSEIIIGKSCGFSGVSITSFDSIVIGEKVRVGANVIIADGDFHLDDPRTPRPKPIRIEDNVWIGAGAVIMKGVTIGKNTIIGMNSIVTKDIPEGCIAAGNPCKVIKQIITN